MESTLPATAGFGLPSAKRTKIGRLDPATGKIVKSTRPPARTSRAGWERIGRAISGSASIEAGKLVKIDHKTGKMTFYTPPTENNGAYHVVADPKNKVIWVTLQTSDKIARFDPKTETWTEFSLPIVELDARRIDSIHPIRTASGGRATPRAISATSRCWISRTLDAQWRTAGSRSPSAIVFMRPTSGLQFNHKAISSALLLFVLLRGT